MSNAFESIKAGLEQAIAHQANKPNEVLVHEMSATDVKAVRDKVGMTQREFAASFGISLGTLRHWERGDRQPHGPARVLLNVLDRRPDAVISTLTESNVIAAAHDARCKTSYLEVAERNRDRDPDAAAGSVEAGKTLGDTACGSDKSTDPIFLSSIPKGNLGPASRREPAYEDAQDE